MYIIIYVSCHKRVSGAESSGDSVNDSNTLSHLDNFLTLYTLHFVSKFDDVIIRYTV